VIARALKSILFVAVLALLLPAAGHAAGPCDAPIQNPIACENSKPGAAPDTWQVQGAGDDTIQGYATSMSVNAGDRVDFKIKSSASSYHIDILRLGYYGGDGARLIASNIRPTARLPQSQPACLTDATTGLVDCGNWGVSASWTVPTDAVSGVYVAHLVRDDTGGDSQIVFVVRNDASHSPMVLQTSDATWQAYNAYGGNSLYSCTVACPPGNPDAYKAAYAVSYNRPFDGQLETDNGRSNLYYAEYQLIRFLERNGYDVSYVAAKDVDANGALLRNHKVFISSGHDEYWSGNQRANVTAARDAGVSLAFFSGNEMFWKTRFGPSIDGASTVSRTLTTYKESHFNAQVDPAGPSIWTGTWGDMRFSPPADAKPQNQLTGQLFRVNSGTSDIKVPAAYSKLRFWRNTQVARLAAGTTLTLDSGGGTLGYEWDVDADNGFRPPGAFGLSSTTVSGVEIFTDYASHTGTGPATHNLTLYRAPSGALVFGAGTVQWSWGLDNTNAWQISTTDPSGNPPDPNMQQATVNLFADMGAQPSTLQSGMVAATKSTDTVAPSSLVTSPAAGSTVADGSKVTISGTASDAGGGVVAGVEVSIDGGATWHPASGTTNWTYTWSAHGNPSTIITARATDDSGNIETPSSSVVVKVGCGCSLFGSDAPATADSGDTPPVELGVKFRSDSFGQITGIRFYKAATNTGTHVGALWTADGQQLAQATFSNESGSGWQQVTFANPVTVTPGTTYVASYFAPNGHYSISDAYALYRTPPFATPMLDSPPLHVIPADATQTNGLFSYSAAPTFPTGSFQATNYFVDVTFAPLPPPGKVTGVTATAGAGSADVTWSAPTSGGPPTAYRVTPHQGTTTLPSTTVSGSPPATSAHVSGLTGGQSYTFTVTATNPAGDAPSSDSSNAVLPSSFTAPTAPRNVQATAATHAARVTWDAPPDDGGKPISNYMITPYLGSTAQSPVSAGGSATSATVSGLPDSQRYTFTVKATNAVGTSPESAASNAVWTDDTLLDFGTPDVLDSGDTFPVELGVKFKSDTFRYVTGVRFYKAASNTGTHVGSLWDSNGNRLAQGTFTDETASGWQQVRFAAPVAISPGVTYIASYLAPAGHYSLTSSGLATAVDNGELHSIPNATDGNGVFRYGASGGFPFESFKATNYWVDVTSAPAPAPGAVTGVTATAGTGSVTIRWTAPTTGGPVSKYTVTPYIGGQAQATTSVTGSPPATSVTLRNLPGGQTLTYTVTASNPSGTSPESSPSNAVTPVATSVPGAPNAVSAAAADATASVRWSAPTDDGGSDITGYTVTPVAGGSAQTPIQVGASATSATVTGLTNGTPYTFRVAAVNRAGAGTAGVSNAVTPQKTILGLAAPSLPDTGDTNSVELGVRFTSDVYGVATGVRFYKAAGNTGTHVGTLWTAAGQRLASGTFTSETASGWQELDFDTPVALMPNTTYVVSYLAPQGHYAATSQAFASVLDNAPLHALASGASGNGLYAYTATGTFPTSSWQATNYWVDVLFSPKPAPGAPTNVTATAGVESATVRWTAPATGGPPTKYVVTPYIGTTAQPATTITGTPPDTSATLTGLTAGQAYTFKVTASNPAGDGPASAASSAVTPTGSTAPGAPTAVNATPGSRSANVTWSAPANDGGKPITGYTVTPYIGTTAQTPVTTDGSTLSATVSGIAGGPYTFRVTATNSVGTGAASSPSNAVSPYVTLLDSGAPASADAGDPGSVELGAKFQSDVAGSVIGVRFYKAAANGGTHVGTLWSAAGTRLGSGTFTSESASGWQELRFASPVAITAGTTYVVSYFAPNGHYAATGAAFASPLDNPPLHAVANSVSANGVYAYTSTGVFPTDSFNSTNYWVDVMFVPGS
jgi:hypothetical protein